MGGARSQAKSVGSSRGLDVEPMAGEQYLDAVADERRVVDRLTVGEGEEVDFVHGADQVPGRGQGADAGLEPGEGRLRAAEAEGVGWDNEDAHDAAPPKKS